MTARAQTKAASARRPAPMQRSREELLEQIGVVLAEVDAAMAKPRGSVGWAYTNDKPLGKHRKVIDDLARELNVVMNPDHDYDAPGAEEAIDAEFAAVPGKVPSWARPGRFVLWVGHVPVLCRWGGFAYPCSNIQPIDRGKPWFEKAAAYRHMTTYQIPAKSQTPEELFRLALSEWSMEASFKLFDLTENGQEAVDEAAEEAGREWLDDVLKAGPMNAIELPTRLTEIQQRLF